MGARSKANIWHKINKLWLRYEYKHTFLAFLAIVTTILLLDSAVFAWLFGFLENIGYIGGFVAGALSVSFFTAVPAVALMVDLADKLNPFLLSLAIALGSTFGDWLTLKFYEEKVFAELQPILKKLNNPSLNRFMKHRFTKNGLFAIGALIIATPLPDELGVSLMGLSHFKRRYIILITFLLNSLGALLLILAVRGLND